MVERCSWLRFLCVVALFWRSKVHIAIYVRVSSRQQDAASQLPDLERWERAFADLPVVWYRDTASGKSMDRPEWRRLEESFRAGEVSKIVCWRLDRLGRTCSGLSALFDELRERKVNLVSLKDGVDLSTPAGRLLANVIASMAQYETEVRAERVAAGLAVARAKGKTWGGSKPGVRKVVTDAQIRTVRTLKAAGETITSISQVVRLSRPTVRSVLA